MNKAQPTVQPDSKWEFLVPNQVKNTQANGSVTTSYSFPITKAPTYSEVLTGTKDQLITGLFTPAVLNSYLLELYNAFLRVHSNRFARNYTPAQLIKVTRHMFNNTTDTSSDATDEEYNFTLTPSKVDIISNNFVICWNVIAESLKIELVESEEELEEVDVTNVLESKGDFLRRDSSKKTEAEKTEAMKQLERIRLKARIAKFKAERALEKYVIRYGPIDPVVLDSDSDNDDS